ncbi:hypothetical protein CGCSCA4_v001045 [Colletotrichum siamense]|uniref:Uncharacterized protein n=1 Tax=Colletotrichum siamense TaxID=690259 RepID=A0A9P5F4H2_COLSI|nr:hypothetical protein CGCSCA4_v001045 [Colletotrichum siamense]KAF4865903.1 hypothetical protein CGCSCA2_v001148 [Colletotrichum siamense]
MLQLSMPSHDELWTATTTDQWSILYSEYASKKSRSLRHELDILYQQKETPPQSNISIFFGRLKASEENEGKARIVVYHAAKLLSWLRDHPTNSHHEPMALLTGTLALWMFTALGKHNKPESSSRSLMQSSPASDGTARFVTLRLDKEIGEEILVKWTSGDRGTRPYIGGVGSLIEQGWSLSIAIGMVLRAQYKNNRRGT